MNHPHVPTAHTAEKKERRSSAARALVVGLVLAFSGAAAWAIGESIPGIDIVVCKGCGIAAPGPDGGDVKLEKNPGGIVASTQTGKGGTYKFTGLAPGKYDLFVGGQHVETRFIEIKLKEVLVSGVAHKPTGSITGVLSRELDGKAKITFNGQTALVLDLFPGAPVNTSSSNKKAGVVAEWGGPAAGDVQGDGRQPGIRDQGAAGNLSSYGTARPPTGGDVKPGLAADEANSAMAAVSTTRGRFVKPDDGAGKLPGLAIAGDPVPGTSVGLDHDPGGVRFGTTPTDPNGAFQFTNVPAGKYKLTLPGQLPKSVSVGADGIIGGTLRRGSDGGMSIFDRWGNQLTDTPASGVAKNVSTPDQAADKPVARNPFGGFGSGAMSGGFPGSGPGAMLPGAGPGAGSPGLSGAMGGPGAGPRPGGPGGPMSSGGARP